MSARDEFRPASANGMCDENVWGPMCDEIDRLRAFERLARERLATTESQLAAELAYEKAWMNGVADAVEHLGFNREAACGPADLLPGLKWLVERTDDCDSDCVHAPMCRKWGPTCPTCNDTGHIDDDAGQVPCPACVGPDGWAETRINPADCDRADRCPSCGVRSGICGPPDSTHCSDRWHQ